MLCPVVTAPMQSCQGCGVVSAEGGRGERPPASGRAPTRQPARPSQLWAGVRLRLSPLQGKLCRPGVDLGSRIQILHKMHAGCERDLGRKRPSMLSYP